MPMTEAQPSAQDTFSGTKPVEDRHRIDETALAAWLEAHVEGYRGPLEVRQFKGGQSNPTYQLVTPERKYVLRRKPPGKLLPSAHAVDREFKVISALYPTGFPVARPYGLCTDESVIGTMFYVMENVEGRILWDGMLPDYSPEERRAIYLAETDTLAALHATKVDAVGLSDFGKPGNYFARQIDRWTKQYLASETVKIETMDKLIDWLPKTVPADDVTSVVHGDYRLDNCMVGDDGRVVAVLDWEICTLGDPMADLGLLQVYWTGPDDPSSAWNGSACSTPGFLNRADLAARYAAASGRDISQLPFYVSFAYWKLACILEGVYARYAGGALGARDAAELEPFTLQVEGAAAMALAQLEALS